MKRIYLILSAFVFVCAANMQAQVTIGSSDEPAPGAVLDLRSNGTLGLLLPHVSLDDASVWKLDGDAVEGMSVFNVSTSIAKGLDGKGIYVWVSGGWSKMGDSFQAPTPVRLAATTATTFIGVGSEHTLGVEFTGSAPYNCVWKKGNEILQEMQNTPNRTSSFNASGFGVYVCEVSNAYSAEPQRITFFISDLNPSDYNQNSDANDADIQWSFENAMNCLDVRDSLPDSLPYSILVSDAHIVKVVWNIEDPSFVLRTSRRLSDTEIALLLKDSLELRAIAPATVILTAYMDLEKSNQVYKVKEEMQIQFRQTFCCDGAVVVNGAYKTEDNVDNNLVGDYVYNWRHKNYSPLNRNLCWAVQNATPKAVSVASAAQHCNNEWRLPSLQEMQVLYEALGGHGAEAYNFNNLQLPNVNVGAVALTGGYWSGERTTDNKAYSFSFANGGRLAFFAARTAGVRCVKVL